MNFIKLNKGEHYLYDLPESENTEIYILKEDKNVIGVGIIKDGKEKENIIELFVHEIYRSNGYGTMILKYLLNILKERGYKEIKFTLNGENVYFINIIKKIGAIHLSIKNNNVSYLVPLL